MARTQRQNKGTILNRSTTAEGGRLSRLLGLVCFLFLLGSQPSIAAEIGQTRDEIISKHGLPFSADANLNTANYRWDVWSLDVVYVEGIATKLTYQKMSPLSDDEIVGILAANGGKDAWTKFDDHLWIRKDGVAGNFTDPKTFSIQGKPRPIPPAQESSPPRLSVTDVLETPLTAPSGKEFIKSRSVEDATRAKSPAGAVFAIITTLLIFGALFGVLFWIRSLRRKEAAALSALTLNGNAPSIPPPLMRANNNTTEFIPPTLSSITWDQFELAVAEIYRRHGYAVELSSGLGADGGIDVKLTRDNETTLIQCKQWKSGKVGVREIREFYGVLVSEGAERGVFITTAEYSRDAREFAEGKPIDLISQQEVRFLVSAVEEPGENFWAIHQWLDDFIANSRIVDPSCPRCQELMVLRHPAHGTPFWGCRTYPNCRGKRDARLEIVRARSYAPKSRTST